eukprot:4905507-Pyramimonas_sp.AAC.1
MDQLREKAHHASQTRYEYTCDDLDQALRQFKEKAGRGSERPMETIRDPGLGVACAPGARQRRQ